MSKHVDGNIKESTKQIKSSKKSSIELSPDEYFDIEHVVRRIAKEHGIDNVEGVNIQLTSKEAIVKFKIAEEEKEKKEKEKKEKEKEEGESDCK